MNSLILSGIIKRLYPDFDMTTFNNRLKLQKIIYLLQTYGINLGYNFELYLYGPYCAELTKTAFFMEDINKIKEVGFGDKQVEIKFLEFQKRISPFKNNLDWLEIASTLHLFTKLYPKLKKDEIILHTQKHKEKFDKKHIEKVWGEMKWLIN